MNARAIQHPLLLQYGFRGRRSESPHNRNTSPEAKKSAISLASAFGNEPGLPENFKNAAIVFVIDDDISVRESLELLIRCEGWRPETFASAQGFLNRPRPLVPSCLVLDLSLPGLNGLQLQKQLAVEHIDLPIIFITGYGDVPKSVQAMKAGAVEFLTKPLDNNALLSAIRKALERSRLALAQDAEMQELQTRYASLTSRERQVLALVVSGLLNKQVGGELGISEITVKAHRRQVMQKMRANSLPDLVRMAERLGPECPVTRQVRAGSGLTLREHLLDGQPEDGLDTCERRVES